jgi:Predicted nucleic-acid-binding protein containing a Zn-ribbon
MFCPNCGHKVDPSQKFCDNCGAALKKRNTSKDLNTDELHQSEDDDTIRSLSDIEAELNAIEKKKNLNLRRITPKHLRNNVNIIVSEKHQEKLEKHLDNQNTIL